MNVNVNEGDRELAAFLGEAEACNNLAVCTGLQAGRHS